MTTKLTEWLTGCPCCGSNVECECDLDVFYLMLDNQRLRAFIQEYATHRDWCSVKMSFDCGECSCGYTKELKLLENKDENY